jgi:glycosyltransferase
MISLVTITYNNYEELLLTVASIPQDQNIESIIINGGDCKKTSEFLKNYSGTVVSERDEGIADAFNKGIKHSTGEYILFLNSGDIYTDHSYLTSAKSFLDNNTSYDFTHANIIFNDEIAGKLRFTHQHESLGKGMPYFHQTMLTRKTVFETIGNFNLRYKIAMDYDFVVRLHKNKNRGHFIDSTPIEMDGQGISSTREIDSVSECYQSLRSHQMLTGQELVNITIRATKIYIRKMLNYFFGKNILRRIKLYKYRQ